MNADTHSTRVLRIAAERGLVRSGDVTAAEGVEHYVVDGVTIRVYSVAKTVADCFKFRSRVGLDLARRALRESRRRKLATVADLRRYAQVCRMTEVMRPYLAGDSN